MILIHKGFRVIRFLKTPGMEKFLAKAAVFMHDSGIFSKIEYKKSLRILVHAKPKESEIAFAWIVFPYGF